MGASWFGGRVTLDVFTDEATRRKAVSFFRMAAWLNGYAGRVRFERDGEFIGVRVLTQ